ncbi:Sbal_3080 family lipoprotein [Microbulbifer magnicolonia]|uniref:Sbal_3080 family lipoprotein n=1 Tax=Microbulbifer magnicolonia TaxID=3109744 RepID=UPI002B411F95|nr:Sbal_3080 family lipoprotein [Microbulbifer sp. GG15]
MIKKLVALLGVSTILGGCSIQQSVEPARVTTGSEICIIENPDVREGFLNEFKSALSSKGVQYKVLPKGSSYVACEWTATYLARWTWDLALYMSYAEINVFHNGAPEGKALYDSTRGGANMSKFIDAETKIRELVDQLLQYETAFLLKSRSDERTFG